MKYKLTIEICESKKSTHVTVSDGDSEFRVYSGKQNVGRVVGGVVNKFYKRYKAKKENEDV